MEYVLDNTIGSVLNVLILTNINILCSLKRKSLFLGEKYLWIKKHYVCKLLGEEVGAEKEMPAGWAERTGATPEVFK